MRNPFLPFAVLISAQICFAGTAIGVNSTGSVFQIDDATGNGTFVNSLGFSGVQSLACRQSDGMLFTEVNGTLYKFSLGGAPVVARTLPFLLGSQNKIAIDATGIGWVVDSGSGNLYRFGLLTGETLVGNVGFDSITAIAFGRDGSLYAMRGTGNASLAGLYIISQTDAHATRVTVGDFDAGDVGAIAEPPGFASLPNFLSCFNTSYRISPVLGTKTLLGGSTSAIRGLTYQGLTTKTVRAALDTVNFGAVNSNTQGCLDDRDGIPLRICRAFVPNITVPPIQFSLKTATVATGTTELALFYKSRMTTAGSFQDSVEMLNAVTGQFDPQATLNVNTSGNVVSVPISNATNYIPASRVLTCRVKVRPTGFVATQAYCYELDQFVVEFR